MPSTRITLPSASMAVDFGGWVNAPHRGPKILRIEIINLPAFVAPYFPHCTHPALSFSQPVDLFYHIRIRFEKSILQEILSLFRFPVPAERPGNQGSLPENGRLSCTVFICQARSDVRRVPFRVFLRFGNRLRLGLAVFRQSTAPCGREASRRLTSAPWRSGTPSWEPGTPVEGRFVEHRLTDIQNRPA